MTADRKPWPTEDAIVVPIPAELAAEFVGAEAYAPFTKRGSYLLQFGSHSLGRWRVDGITSDANGGFPRLVATLRRVIGT